MVVIGSLELLLGGRGRGRGRGRGIYFDLYFKLFVIKNKKSNIKIPKHFVILKIINKLM